MMKKIQKHLARTALIFMVLGTGGISMAQTHTPPPLLEAYQPNYNGILRLYNMFPRNYENFDAMTADLARVRNMGFTHVWLNPLHLATEVEKKDWPEGTPNGLRGSLYAMRDPYQFNPSFSAINEDERATLSSDEIFKRDKAALMRFTAKARELGMVPMFDLVLSHIAPDSSIVDGTHAAFQGVNTHPWVARYPNGKPKRHGLDENGNILPEIKYPDKEVWDDVVMLQYEVPEVRQQIIEHLWKPFVDMYFDMGFQGIRVDSVANNDADVMDQVVGHFRQRHIEKYGIEPTILGESLGGTPERQARIQPHATHLYNSAYWVPNLTGPNMAEDGNDAKTLWGNDKNWFITDMAQKQALVFTDENGAVIKERKGGTVGYAGSHDELPWVLHFPKSPQGITAEERDAQLFRAEKIDFEIDASSAEQALREKMAVAALASDGGWFLTSYDEKLDTTLRSVFDKHSKGEQLANLEPFVADLNAILAAQPENELGSWSKRFFIDDIPELVIIERHTGFAQANLPHLILVNTSPTRLNISADTVRHIATLTRRDASSFANIGADSRIWIAGDITLPDREQLPQSTASFEDRILAMKYKTNNASVQK